MKSRIVILIIVVLATTLRPAKSQSSDGLLVLRLGDKAPDYEFASVSNYKNKTLKLSDFSGKLVILDFWNTSCASCIASWPHLLEIQKEFGDKIQIILVNPMQDPMTIKKVFERRKTLANVDMTLPSVSSDPNILKLFPVSGIPHVVWLDGNRVVKSVTYSASVNSKNIKGLLNNENVNMPQKLGNEEYISAIFQKPLFLDENGGKAQEIYAYSFFGKGDYKLFPTYGLVSNDERKEYFIVLTNYCLMDFYRLAYSNRFTHLGLEMVMANRTVLQTPDSARYIEKVNGEQIRDNLFVYQVISPPASTQDLQSLMKADLQRFVGLDAKWVKMKKKCLVLTAKDTALIAYKSGGRRAVINETDINLNNVTVKYFLDFMEDGTNYYYSPYPFVDETNFKGMLGDIVFTTEVSDYKKLNKELQKYKMSLTIEDRVIDVLVITEGKNRKSFQKQF